MESVLDHEGLDAWEAFVFAHAAAVGRIERDLAAAGHISLTWYDVLAALSEAPEHRLRLHELANEVVLSRSGLTRLLDRLEAAGFIAREPDPGDRRGTYAAMTPLGEETLLRTWPAYAAGIARYFSQHLTEEEKAVMAAALRRLRTAVMADSGAPAGQTRPVTGSRDD